MGFTYRKYSYNDVVMFLNNHDCSLLTKEDEYKTVVQKLSIKCNCGKAFDATYNSIKDNKSVSCKECKEKERLRKCYYNFENYINKHTNLKIMTPVNKYKGKKQKVELECECGELFLTNPFQITQQNKHTCNRCVKKKMGEKFALTIEEIINTIDNDSSGCIYVGGEYINNKSILTIKCPCGNLFDTQFSRFTSANKKQCNECGNKNNGDSKRISYNDVYNFILNKGMHLITTEEGYSDANSTIEIKCICGETFKNNFSMFKYGKGIRCSSCSKKYSLERKIKPYEEVKSYIEYSSSCKLITKESDYVNTHTYITFLCGCGEEFQTSFHEYKSGNKRQCNICGNNHMKIKDFISIFDTPSLINNCKLLEFEETDGYVLSTSKVKLLCECGQEFSTKRHTFTHYGKTRCATCNGIKSNGEIKIENHLNCLSIKNETQFKFTDCRGIRRVLPFDFAVMDNQNNLKFLIEYDGIQHFKPVEVFGGINSFEITVKNDGIKNEYCKNNDIPLLRIPYWELNRIDYIVENALIYFGLMKSDSSLDTEAIEMHLV